MVGHGHVAPCARCCAGSRRPDHARRPLFVRSRRQAHAHPRRAILSSAGPLWRAHQHSHNHIWPRTTFSMGGQEAVQERGRHRQHPSRNVRGTSASRANANAAGSPPRSRPIASPLPALLPACCHCLAFPAMPHSTSLLTAMPGPRPSAALYAGRREIPVSPRPAWPPSPALYVCVCVMV